MRKSIVVLSSLGLGAGLLYALKSNRQARGSDSVNEEVENARSEQATASENGRSDQVRPTSVNGKNKCDGGEGETVGSSMGLIEDGTPVVLENELEPQIDDRGTDQSEASHILKNIRDTAFDSSDEKLALALGRPAEEIEAWTSGSGIIDGDVVMKARGLAIQRGIEIE
jgi:hypothetical protein